MMLESIQLFLQLSLKSTGVDTKDKRRFHYYCGQPIQNIQDNSQIELKYITNTNYNITEFQKTKENIKAYTQIVNIELDESPNDYSIQTALNLLDKLNDLDISPITNPSMDGGIMFEFFKNSQYFLLEIYNTGQIVLLESGAVNEVKEYTLVEVKDKLECIANGKLQMC